MSNGRPDIAVMIPATCQSESSSRPAFDLAAKAGLRQVPQIAQDEAVRAVEVRHAAVRAVVKLVAEDDRRVNSFLA